MESENQSVRKKNAPERKTGTATLPVFLSGALCFPALSSFKASLQMPELWLPVVALPGAVEAAAASLLF